MPMSFQASGGATPCTWANRPDAVTAGAGAVIRIINVGHSAAGSLWISDGAIWRPFNGAPVTLAETVSDLVLTTGNVVLVQAPLPPMLLRNGAILRASIEAYKTNSTGFITLSFRVGKLGTTADASVRDFTGFIGGGAFWSSGATVDILRMSASTAVARGNPNPNALFPMGASSSDTFRAPTTVHAMDTESGFLSVTGSLTDGDTYTIRKGARIELISIGN